MSLHPLLSQQLQDAGLDASGTGSPEPLERLLGAIDAAYARADAERNELEGAVNALSEETHHVREELDRRIREAQEAERAKSNFVANMSHEIRAPMNGIVGMADLLLETELTSEQQGYAETVRRSAHSLLSILNDILDFSKMEAGMLEIDPIPFDLRRSAEDVAELLAPEADSKKLELIVRYDPAAPRHLIGDPGRIRQIMLNLVGNAIKFTRDGHVLLDIECREASETRAVIRMSVHDTGVGIARKHVTRIFDKFTQEDGSNTRRFGGTGLGLAISKRLSEIMGGTLSVESTEGEGSHFWCEIPLRVNREAPAPLKAGSLTGLRVMVIDSSATSRRILVEQLHHWGMRAHGSNAGGDALRELRQAQDAGDPFRIAILSNHLEGMDAVGLGDLVKSDPELRSTDLVLLTPLGEQGDARKLGRIGFSGYLVKPVQEEALRETLAVVWGARKEGEDPGLVTRHRLEDSAILEAPFPRQSGG